jgi:hypothetical protein
MALKDTYKHLKDLLIAITHDLDKAENGNKAASQRVRTGTVKMEKIAKLYRKESIKSEKINKGTKKTAKKATANKPTNKPAKKAAPTAKKTAAKAPAQKAVKVKAKAKAKSVSRPRALSFKKPSAKLPVRKANQR